MVQMKSTGMKVMKITKKVNMTVIIHKQNLLFGGWWHFSLHFKLHMLSLTLQLTGYSHTAFTVLYSVCPTPFLYAVISLLPCSLYLAWKLLHLHDDNFIRYVVCPKCESLYEYHECICRVGNELESKRCTYIAFKNHPFVRYRNPCDTVLLKKVSLKHGKTKLVPKKEYPYRSVIKSLNVLLQRPSVLEKLDAWKERSVPDGLLTDIYDGKYGKSL